MDDLNTVVEEPTDQTSDPSVVVADPSTPEPAPFVNEQELMDRIRATPDLEHVFKKMQGSYTRKMQEASKLREAASVVERFNTDPEFARQTILSRAAQLGLQVAAPGSSPGLPHRAAKNMPSELVEAVKSNLSPELQWMAPALAASQWAGMQMALQPIQEHQAQTLRSTRDQEYEQLVEQLSEKAPGWEAHEDDMDSLLTFLQSPKMSDRRWGSKLEMLHRVAAGGGHATAEAARRMGQAGRSRAPAGLPTATPAPNIAEQVRKPKNTQDAWEIAAKFAASELARQGIKVS